MAGAINVGLVFASLGVMAARYLGGRHGLHGRGVATLAYPGFGELRHELGFLGALAAGALRTPWSTGPRAAIRGREACLG